MFLYNIMLLTYQYMFYYNINYLIMFLCNIMILNYQYMIYYKHRFLINIMLYNDYLN